MEVSLYYKGIVRKYRFIKSVKVKLMAVRTVEDVTKAVCKDITNQAVRRGMSAGI